MEAIEKVLSKVTLSDVEAAPPVQLTKRVTNAHIDDIHGLQLLDTSVFGDEKSTRFLSGSKDGKVKIWNVDGKMEWEMPCSEKSEGDYSRWITALSSCGKKFQAGTRNGVLHSWIKSARSADSDIAFQEVGSFKIPPLVVGGRKAVAKERNQSRINCIFPVSKLRPDDDVQLGNMIFIGQPRGLSIFNTATSKVETSYILHANDWVYCIVPLMKDPADPLLFAIVVGSALETYLFDADRRTLSKRSEIWNCHSVPSETRDRFIRPHIASLVKVCSESSLLVGGCFDGCVRCFDVVKKCCTSELTGHTGRVWDVLSLSASTVISGADDKTVRLWDIRCRDRCNLIWKSDQLVGRASSLLQISECCVVCGSCADKPQSSRDKGCLYFFDIRYGK